jgi:hypothetical protein
MPYLSLASENDVGCRAKNRRQQKQQPDCVRKQNQGFLADDSFAAIP